MSPTNLTSPILPRLWWGFAGFSSTASCLLERSRQRAMAPSLSRVTNTAPQLNQAHWKPCQARKVPSDSNLSCQAQVLCNHQIKDNPFQQGCLRPSRGLWTWEEKELIWHREVFIGRTKAVYSHPTAGVGTPWWMLSFPLCFRLFFWIHTFSYNVRSYYLDLTYVFYIGTWCRPILVSRLKILYFHVF